MKGCLKAFWLSLLATHIGIQGSTCVLLLVPEDSVFVVGLTGLVEAFKAVSSSIARLNGVESIRTNLTTHDY